MSSRLDARASVPPTPPPGSGEQDTLDCLSHGAQSNLEWALDQFTSKGILKPGKQYASSRPGSGVVILKEQRSKTFTPTFFRYFFCAPWRSPTGKWEVVYDAKGGGCYVTRH